MNNIIFGITVTLLASVGYFYSWRFQKQEQYRCAIVLIIISSLGLYCYVAADFFLHIWDERFHALVAKNMIGNPLVPTLYENPVLPYDYKDWSANHIWVHKQPFPLWTIAASMWLFGVNEIALRLPSILLVITSIYLVFSIGSYLFNRKTAWLASLLFSINGLVIALMGGRIATDHVDIFFMFFILLAIHLSIQYVKSGSTIYSLLVGISLGIAILTKWLPALIVLPIWLLLVWDSGKFDLKTSIVQLATIIVTLTVVFLPWQLYIFFSFPEESAWESIVKLKHLHEVVEGNTGSVFWYLNRIRINYGELIYLPLAWFICIIVNDLGNKRHLAVMVWFLVPFLFFSMVKTKMQGYLLITAPALFFMTAAFFFALTEYKKNRRFEWAINILLALLILFPVRYSFERMKLYKIRDRNPQWVVDLRKLNKKQHENGILFNYERPIEAMFYTDLIVYPYIPKKEKISELRHQGYTIIINDDGNIPKPFSTMEQIVRVKLTKPNNS